MNKFILKIAKWLVGPNHVVIPVKPPRELLVSMAFRENHAFCMNDLTDREIIELRKVSPIMGRQYLTSTEKENTLVRLSQLHEEVVGKGFFNYDQK